MNCPYIRPMSTDRTETEIYFCDPPGRPGVRHVSAVELHDRCLSEDGYKNCPGYHAAVTSEDERSPFPR